MEETKRIIYKEVDALTREYRTTLARIKASQRGTVGNHMNYIADMAEADALKEGLNALEAVRKVFEHELYIMKENNDKNDKA